MTDEEKAEEYKESKRLHCIPKERYIMEAQESRLTEIKQAFLAGLKAGRPKWHKVSEQIPTEEKSYLVKLTDGTVDVMTIALDGNLEPYLLILGFDFYKDVEKWCEIPKEV